MARRGTFGRLPRAAPSLTATIVSIAREMQAARDRNIMSAWKNGGTFEGKPVTDSMLLGHFRKRMSGLDKKDPLYDSYKLEVDQLDYSIHESRQSTLYAQGKISDRQMGQFYLNWAKKVPKDSEFYRQLQRDGARFIQAAQARGRAGAARAKESAYQDAQKNAVKGAAAGEIVKWGLTGLAVAHSLLDPTSTKGLNELSDPAQLAEIIQRVNENPDDVMFTVNGQNYTGRDWFAEIKAADPTFVEPTLISSVRRRNKPLVGGVTNEYILSSLQGAHQTYLDMANRAHAAGKKTDEKAYTKSATATTELTRVVNLFGPAASYNMVIEERDRVLNDPTSTNVEKDTALDDAAHALARIAQTPGLDARTRFTLINEANANKGYLPPDGLNTPTFGQDYLGVKVPPAMLNTTTTGGKDAADDPGGNAAIYGLASQLNGELAALSQAPWDSATRSGFMTTFGTRDPNTGVFEFDPKGKEIGVVNGVDVARSGDPAVAIAVPQAGGSPLLVWVTGHEIISVARDANGNVIDTGRPNPDGTFTKIPPVIGTVYTYNTGGQEVRLYQTPDGVFTTVPPWAANASEQDRDDGSIIVDVTALVGEGLPGSARAVNADGEPTDLFYDPQVTAVSAIRQAAGYNPETDFNTALVASLAASPDAQSAARAFIRDPLMQAYLQEQQQASVFAAGGSEVDLARVQGLDSNMIARTAGIAQSSSAANYSPLVTPRTDRFGNTEVKPELQAPVLPGTTLRQMQPGGPLQRPTISIANDIKVPQVPWGTFNTPGFRAGEVGSPFAGPATPVYRAPSSLVQPAALQPRTPSTAVAPTNATSTVAPRPIPTPVPTVVQPGPVVSMPLVSPVFKHAPGTGPLEFG